MSCSKHHFKSQRSTLENCSVRQLKEVFLRFVSTGGGMYFPTQTQIILHLSSQKLLKCWRKVLHALSQGCCFAMITVGNKPGPLLLLTSIHLLELEKYFETWVYTQQKGWHSCSKSSAQATLLNDTILFLSHCIFLYAIDKELILFYVAYVDTSVTQLSMNTTFISSSQHMC